MLKGGPINQLLNLGAKHALFFKDSTWYHELKEFPGVLIDPNGYVKFENRPDYLNHVGLDFGPAENQVHIRPYGISALPTYQPFSQAQRALLVEAGLLKPSVTPSKLIPEPTTEPTLKRKREVEFYIRDKKLVDKIKKLYKNTCQICGTQLKVRTKGPIFYSEVHHIKGLGAPHFGPDVMGNLICVCADHHTRLDFFTFPLVTKDFKLNKHKIDSAFVEYHNQQVKLYNP